jgi:hypothetical protein
VRERRRVRLESTRRYIEACVLNHIHAMHILRLDANYATNMEAQLIQDFNEMRVRLLRQIIQYLATQQQKSVYTKEQDVTRWLPVRFLSRIKPSRWKEGQARKTQKHRWTHSHDEKWSDYLYSQAVQASNWIPAELDNLSP